MTNRTAPPRDAQHEDDITPRNASERAISEAVRNATGCERKSMLYDAIALATRQKQQTADSRQQTADSRHDS